jgi:hypothetical protein
MDPPNDVRVAVPPVITIGSASAVVERKSRQRRGRIRRIEERNLRTG